MNTAKHHLLGNSYAVTVLYLSLFFLCTTILWGQSHKTNLADNSRSFYNLNSYPKAKKVSIESWKKYNDPKDYSHPDFGLDMSNKPCESCVEVLQKRTENSRYYINTEEPSEFFVTQSLNPINYKVNGYLMAMDAHLFDKGNGIHENRFFVQETGVNTITKNTYLNTDQGKLKFNKWTLWTRKNGIETLVGTANWENYTIGEEGMYIKNIFKGIDAEMIVGNGRIKTNFIMSSNLYGVYDELIFRDEIVINNSPVSISFKDGSSSLEGMGRIVIKSNENLAELNSAVIYPEGHVQEQSQIAMYAIKQNSLGVVVPYRWITENIKKTRLIIDPEFTGTGTLNWINILGSMYNPTCSFINSCDYNINVVQPAATTVTDLYFNFSYEAVQTSICWKDDGGFKITYGGCAYPSNSTVAFCPNDGFKGECYANNLSLLSAIQSCITTTSCAQRTLPFVLKFYRKCKGNTGCDYDCIDAARNLLITLKGRTIELPPAASGGINLTATSICAGQSMPVTTNGGQYGVPPYTYNWSFNASGTPSLGTTTNPNITFPTAGTQTVYLFATDSCGNTVIINRNVTVNASVTPAVTITANPSGAICPGTSVTFTANPTNGGTPVYQWKRNGTNVGTNSATYTNPTLANGDVITVTMTTSLGVQEER
jgi:hypothetical protein